ncbi:MAG: hypothetical protein LLG06_01270 [Desulfobacteraceae bacterium]|nr:hypothetical protein [Desulfobacteraceae bacterium]
MTKTNQTSRTELVRGADISVVMDRLDLIQTTLEEMRSALPLKRRRLSRATRRAHADCILHRYEGKCPLCRATRIISESGLPLPVCHQEHFVNRHENALDKTWLVCAACNSKKATGEVAHTDVDALFRAYQVTLRAHLAGLDRRLPRQIRMENSGKLCTFGKKKAGA